MTAHEAAPRSAGVWRKIERVSRDRHRDETLLARGFFLSKEPKAAGTPVSRESDRFLPKMSFGRISLSLLARLPAWFSRESLDSWERKINAAMHVPSRETTSPWFSREAIFFSKPAPSEIVDNTIRRGTSTCELSMTKKKAPAEGYNQIASPRGERSV